MPGGLRRRGHLGGFASRLPNQLRADRKVIAEAAKAEPLAQPRLLNFDPADRLQIARGHAQQRALLGEVAQYVFYARHQLRIQLIPPLRYAVPHRFQNGVVSLFKYLGGNPGLVACLAQDGGIGVAMQQHPRQGNLESRYPMHA